VSDTPDEANEPSYTQLGEDGNPFSKGPVDPEGDTSADSDGQPDLDLESDDEQDRAERHD
jgi:hypothetical protein